MWRWVSLIMLVVFSWNLGSSLSPLIAQEFDADDHDFPAMRVELVSQSAPQNGPTIRSESKSCDSSNCENEACQFHFCHFGHCGYVISPPFQPTTFTKVTPHVVSAVTVLSSVVLPGLIKPPSVS